MVDVDIRWPGPGYPLGCEMEKGIHIFVMRRTHGTLSPVMRALNTFGEEINKVSSVRPCDVRMG